MAAREKRDKQRESESGLNRQNCESNRISEKVKHDGGPLTKSAAKVDPISEACGGNDRDGNDELVLEHPFSESIDLYNLPFEMLDVILQKSYLYWILNSSTEQRDEEIIRSLISVDVSFNKRITRQRFKKAIWSYLKDFYRETKKRHAIIRNNRNYLVENIQPTDELLASLLSLNCITVEESQFIQRQRSTRDKNYELLCVMESFDETKFSTFVNCLRRTNQRMVTKILENGGGVIKIQVRSRDAKCTAMETKINDLRDRTKPRSHKTDKLLVQLREEGLEILGSQLDGQTVVVWIWCHSQTAIENLQKLYESNQLRDEYFENIQPYTSKVINIDRIQFKKTIVARPFTINVTQRIEMSQNENLMAFGVTKLRNEIYVLIHTEYTIPHAIRVFEDRYPFRLQTDIKTAEFKYPINIVSTEKENCLYVGDIEEKCVWKITRETDDQHKIIKWLTTDPWSLSLLRDGELLMINRSSHSLMIYGSDAKLIRSIPLTRDIIRPQDAVETSIGNFIITDRHIAWGEEEDGKKDEDKNEDGDEDEVVIEEMKHTKTLKSRGRNCGSNRRMRKMISVVNELTRDGQMVIRRFNPSDKTQQLIESSYLLIDSDDRVFVANDSNDRVILLDSDLKWIRTICPTREGKEEQILKWPCSLFYDDEMKQLIVGGLFERHVNVYTLSQN